MGVAAFEDVEVVVDGREYVFDGTYEHEFEPGLDAGYVDEYAKEHEYISVDNVREILGEDSERPVAFAGLPEHVKTAMRDAIRDECEARAERMAEAAEERRRGF